MALFEYSGYFWTAASMAIYTVDAPAECPPPVRARVVYRICSYNYPGGFIRIKKTRHFFMLKLLDPRIYNHCLTTPLVVLPLQLLSLWSLVMLQSVDVLMGCLVDQPCRATLSTEIEKCRYFSVHSWLASSSSPPEWFLSVISVLAIASWRVEIQAHVEGKRWVQCP